MAEFSLNSADIAIVVTYFVLIGALLIGVSLRRQRAVAAADSGSENEVTKESEEFFLAGRKTSWIGVGCSLFMSNIGSEHFVALAGSGANSGLAVANFEWLSALCITLVLGYLFVPFYLSTRIKTIPEFMSVRFSLGARLYISLVSVFTGVVVKICVTLYSGSLVLQTLLGWSEWTSLLTLVIGTCVYTIIGGLEAVIFTEIIQAVVLLMGGLPLAFLSLKAVGGWSALSSSIASEPDQREIMLHLFQPLKGPEWIEYPWTGVLLGLPAMMLYYWCTDQVITQRVLAAKNIAHARGGCVLTAFAKLLIPPIMVFPGLCARILFDDVKDDPNLAFPTIVKEVLPHGLLGLMVAAMLAALMSSLASTYNSTSAIISYDLYRRLRPSASEKSLVLVGRISIVVLTIIGILWIPIINHSGSGLYVYIQSIISYIAPPIAVVYFAGTRWRRATPKAAVITLYVGGCFGLARLIVETIVKSLKIPAQNAFLKFTVYSNFLHFAFFSTCLSTLLLVISSFLTKPAKPEQIEAVFEHVRKANELASYAVVEDALHSDLYGDNDSDDDDGPHEVVSKLQMVNVESLEAQCLGNDAKKVLINAATSIHAGLALGIFWNFR